MQRWGIKMKNNNLKGFHSALNSLSVSILAVIVGLVVGLFVLIICNPDKGFQGFLTLITAGIGQFGMKAVGNIFYYATPILMTGLGVAIAFKAGVFNIGGGGQFIVGAFTAVYTAIKCQWLPGVLHWIVPLILAGAAGALWAMLPGLLNAYRKVNIIISTIMMNYIGLFLVNYIIKHSIYNAQTGQAKAIPQSAMLPTLGLDKIFPGSSINMGILIAIAIAVLVYIFINKTTFGYELVACGMNSDACKFAGIKEKRNIVMSIMISGALIGIGGALLYLSSRQIKVVDTEMTEGYTGIAVSVLANNSPIGVILSALFMGYLTVGGQYIQSYGFVKEIVDIITSVIIFFAGFTYIIRMFLNLRGFRKYAMQGSAAQTLDLPEEKEKGKL